MPQHIVSAPDGSQHIIEAPEGATPEQITAFAQQALGGGQPQPQAPGAVQSGLEGFGQGLTLNTSDELEGAARAAYAKATGTEPGPNPNIETDDQDRSFNALFSRFSGQARQRQAAEAAAHPYAYGAGEIAGGVGGALATGGGGIGIRGAEGIGSRVLGGAVEGGTYGGLYGAGGSDPGQRTAGAVQGTVGGAAQGGFLPPAIDVGSALLKPMTRGIRAVSEPTQVSNEKLAEAVGRDFGASGNTGNLQTAASDLNARMAGAAASGKPLILADFLGENGRRLMRSAVDMPNDKRNAFNQLLDTRQETQWSRMEGDLAQGLGNPSEYKASLDQIVAERAKAAASDFAKARAVDTPLTPELRAVLDRPKMKELWATVKDQLANRGEPIGFETRTDAMHRMKVELDNQIGAAQRAAKTGNDRTAASDVATYTKLKSDLLDAIDNPAYKSALDNYAGESALKNALEAGRDDALTLDPEEIAQKMRGFKSQSEADMYRLGASREIAGKKLRPGDRMNDRTKGSMNSPDMDLRLKALYPDQASLDAFMANKGLERDAYKTRAAAQGGSRTSGNLTEADEAGKPVRALSAIGNAMAGRFEPMLFALSRMGNRFSGMTPATANATLETMMTPVQRGGTMVIPNALRAAMTHAAQIPANRAQVSNALIGGGVPLVGRQTMGPDSEFDPYRR